MDVDLAPATKTKRNLSTFERCYQKWVIPVYRYFRSRVASEKEAEDLTSEVFLKVYEQLPFYTERGQFPAWLFTIVRHQIADHYRNDKSALPLEDLELPDERANLLEQTTRTDDLARLRQLISALPEMQLELIRLRFVAELTYRDIAVILGSSREAVRKQITRLLDRLHDQMEEDHA
jgi:RNA polymerase sigma-70 factor (ECF subfamily)